MNYSIKCLSFTIAIIVLSSALIGCSDQNGGTSKQGTDTIPPPGPHFSHLPISLNLIARITPLGYNNKTFPVGHTYWQTCDIEYLLNSGQACQTGTFPIYAPRDGTVRSVAPDDGHIIIEGPPGLIIKFDHVNPIPDLASSDAVQGGQHIGNMYQITNFDFGVINYGLQEHFFINPERYPESYLFVQNPIEQYPEPLRSQLLEYVQTFWDPSGYISSDIEGTASGNWFKEGAPNNHSAASPDYAHTHLYLGRLAEKEETRIIVVGDPWADMPNRMAVVDSDAPSWDELTLESTTVVRLWGLSPDGDPELNFPHGTVLLEVLENNQLRIEWFDTHNTVLSFGENVRLYER